MIKSIVMFAIFDFNGTMTLSFPEWSVLVISFLQAVARLLKKDFLSKTKMEKIAKIVPRFNYLVTNSGVYQGRYRPI
jgi:hypothetical protein